VLGSWWAVKSRHRKMDMNIVRYRCWFPKNLTFASIDLTGRGLFVGDWEGDDVGDDVGPAVYNI